MKPIPIVALCGFLGSGKTTLLRRWRRDETLKDAPVIVHDFSEFGLDAELLSDEESSPTPGRLVGGVAALHGSHAREQLHPSVGAALEEIAALEPAPPLVLCESTGAARPWPLIQALTQDERYSLRHFIVTVDALNVHRDFADGRVLTGEASPLSDKALQRAAAVLAEQIAFASVIILTKVDTVPKESVEAQVKSLQTLQPQVTIGLSAQAGLLLPQLEETPAPQLSLLKKRAAQFGLDLEGVTAEKIESLLIRDSRPFHPERLYEACRSSMGTGVYRTKGFLWLASRPGDVLLWQQSGSQIALELTGTWRAEIAENREGRLVREEVEHLQALLAEKDPVYGDRHAELTVIGLQPDLNAFATTLKAALCTDEEVAAWQGGESFPDPWPTSLRRVG